MVYLTSSKSIGIQDEFGIDNVRNQAIVQQLVQQTIEHLSSAIDGKGMTSSDLKDHLKSHFDMALVEFFKISDSADPMQCAMYKGLLIAQLKSGFRQFCLDFENKQAADLSIAVYQFRSRVEAQLMFECIPTDNLQQILNAIKADVLQELNFDLFPHLSDQLVKLLDEAALCFISDNNGRLSELHGTFNSILPDLLGKYEGYVEMLLPDEELEGLSEQKLNSTFEKCQIKTLAKLNEKIKFDNEDIKKWFETNLITLLRQQSSEKLNMAQLEKEKKIAEAALMVSSTVDTFAKCMSTKFEQHSDDSIIKKFHEDEIKSLISSITIPVFDILPDRAYAKQILEDAKRQMDNIVQEMYHLRQTQTEQFKQQWETTLNCIVEEFHVRFSKLLKSKTLPDIEGMKSDRARLIKESVQKINSSWISGHNKREDLIKVLYKDAEQRMFISSLPIMEKHSKMLDDIFDQHQLQMNECLKNHKVKLSELLKGDLHDEIVNEIKRFGENAIQQFIKEIDNVTPTCRRVTTKLTSDLKDAISKLEDEFANQVRNRKLVLKAELAHIIDATINDYSFSMNAFLIASNYSKDKMTQIHGHLKEQVESGLQWKLKLGKFSVDQTKMRPDLNSKMATIYNNILSAIDAQHQEWKKKLESCQQKATNHYIHQFNSLMGQVPEEAELGRIHAELKNQTVELWEKLYPMDCCAEKLLTERSSFSNNLDNIFATTIREKWQQINLDIDRSVKNSVEQVVKQYERKMEFILSSFDYVSADMITSNHSQYLEEAFIALKIVPKPKNVNENLYNDLLNSRINSSLEYFLIKNSQKKKDIETNIFNGIRHMKEMFARDISHLNVLPKLSSSVNRYENRVKSIFYKCKTPDNGKELNEFALSELEKALRDVFDEWDNKQPDQNELQLRILEAVEKYNKEMENRTSIKGKVFVSSAINVIHRQASAVVLEDFQLKIRQTSATREKFNSTIADVFQKHQDLNNIKAADCFDAAIGIDLGTTFSCVAIYKGGKIEMIPDREHHSNTVPSYVFYEKANKAIVGHSAKDQSVIHPRHTIFDSKRLIGRKLTDSETMKDIAQWPFKVVPDPVSHRKSQPKIEVHGQTIHPEEVSGEVLKHLKSNAELYLGREVKDVVITVPAYFNDSQKHATKAAAAFANINVLEIINEPTSAAIAYSLNYTDVKARNILIFDLGGGTFDVSILSAKKCNLTVKAVGGDNHLGGEDFDSNMVDFCIKKFRQQTGLIIPKNDSNSIERDADNSKMFERLRRLRHKCEQAKINLSKAAKVRVVVDYIYEQNNLDVEITVEDFNEMNQHLFNKCIQVVKQTVDESKLTREQIDEVILVGGSSRIPEVQRILTEFFNGKCLTMTINPDEVVAQGAAYRAAMISGEKSSELKGIKFTDVNPLSLGVEVIGEKFSVIIPKNTSLPTKKTKYYHTSSDFQTKMHIAIYEGENPKIENNNLLGEFTLLDIPPKRKGEEPVDVTIECDGEGLIHVTAAVRSNNSSENIKIHSNRGNLTEEDIQTAKARNAS